MRHLITICLLGLGLLAPAIVRAAEPKCPLDPDKCLEEFEKMRHRPWLGVRLDTDSTGRMEVLSVVPGSPAAKAGVRKGDLLRGIDGKPPAEWFASKAGWGPAQAGRITVGRGRGETQLRLPYEAMPEEMFARIVGLQMVNAHLAYMPNPEATTENH
jgi:PDZ domain-containing protein